MVRGSARAWTGAVLAALLIGMLTLRPSGDQGSAGPVLCIVCGERGVADALLNIILFLPLGASLFRANRSLWKASLWPAVFSMAIEVAQIWIPGRDSNPGDLIFNAVGATLGAWTVFAAPSWMDWGQRRKWFVPAVLASSLVALVAAAALLSPDLPRTTYFGQWTPRFQHLEWYHGEVIDARVGSMSIPSSRVDDSAALRSLLRDNAPIEVNVLAGPTVIGLAPIFSIADDRLNSIALVGIDRDDAVFRYRTRSSALRLDQPDLRLPDGFSRVQPGDTLLLAVRSDGESFCFDIASRQECGIGFRLADTWGVLIYAGSWPAGVKNLTGLGWLAALFAPTGFLLLSPRRLTIAAMVIAAGLTIIAWITPVLPVTLPEITSAIAGLASGFVLRHLSCPRSVPAGLK